MKFSVQFEKYQKPLEVVIPLDNSAKILKLSTKISFIDFLINVDEI
jgi:hypothetical protein